MSWSTCSRAIKGWLAGCGAATAVITVFFAVVLSIASRGEGLSAALLISGLVFTFTCLLSGIPAVLVIWLSERFAIRSILFFAGTGAVIGVLGQGVLFGAFGSWPSGGTLLFGAAGCVAGLAYWRVAGRHAGSEATAAIA